MGLDSIEGVLTKRNTHNLDKLNDINYPTYTSNRLIVDLFGSDML